jgi:Domain of unknown function (DUF5615)
MRAAGFDIITAFENAATGDIDEDQLATATRLGRAIYTFDYEDFARIHTTAMRSGRHHAGIVVVREQRTEIGLQVRCLRALTNKLSLADMSDRLEYLAGWA